MEHSNKDIMQGKVCPYCFGQTEYVDSSVIYGKSYGMMYRCKPCNAWVGVHNGTDKALGRLANKQLRDWKIKAHDSIDVLWKYGIMTRSGVYEWLSRKLGISSQETHIGMFDIDTCMKVVELSDKKLKSMRKKKSLSII